MAPTHQRALSSASATRHDAHPEANHKRRSRSRPSSPAVNPSLLQPRVAVALNVPPPWHPWLFALRLCSILPAMWWGLPCALQLLLRLLPGEHQVVVVRRTGVGSDDAVPFALTEAALATIWVCRRAPLHWFSS